MAKRKVPRFVYIAQHPIRSILKIGNSARPFERAWEQGIQIIGILPEHTWLGQTHEKELHERFKHQHVENEWFRDCDELRSFLFHSEAHGNLWTWDEACGD